MFTAVLRAPRASKNRSFESPKFWYFESRLSTDYGATVAEHRAGVWHSRRGIFISVDFESPVIIAFRNDVLAAKETLGPYPRLRLLNNGMWATGQVPELLTDFSPEHQTWKLMVWPAANMTAFSIVAG